jgi:hypothetical protein
MSGNDVVVDFWEAHERQQTHKHGPLAKHALNKCEEKFMRSEWERLGFWHAIYAGERARSQSTARFRGPRS